jgi:hypothetical protein
MLAGWDRLALERKDPLQSVVDTSGNVAPQVRQRGGIGALANACADVTGWHHKFRSDSVNPLLNAVRSWHRPLDSSFCRLRLERDSGPVRAARHRLRCGRLPPAWQCARLPPGYTASRRKACRCAPLRRWSAAISKFRWSLVLRKMQLSPSVFGGAFLAIDGPASSAQTRELRDWQPTQPGLLEDLELGHYFVTPFTRVG